MLSYGTFTSLGLQVSLYLVLVPYSSSGSQVLFFWPWEAQTTEIPAQCMLLADSPDWVLGPFKHCLCHQTWPQALMHLQQLISLRQSPKPLFFRTYFLVVWVSMVLFICVCFFYPQPRVFTYALTFPVSYGRVIFTLPSLPQPDSKYLNLELYMLSFCSIIIWVLALVS